MQKPTNMQLESARYWNNIVDKEYGFDTRKKSIDCFKAVTA